MRRLKPFLYYEADETGEDEELLDEHRARETALCNAENGILAVLGMVDPSDIPPYPNSRDTARAIGRHARHLQEAENDMGLFLSLSTMSMSYLMMCPLDTLRTRLLTFKLTDSKWYITQIIQQAWETGTFKQLYAGVPALFTLQALYVGTSQLEKYVVAWILRKLRCRRSNLAWKSLPKLLGPVVKIRGMELCLSSISWLALYPIYRHATLQSLGLIPLRPVLPPLSSFNPRTFVLKSFILSLAGLHLHDIISEKTTRWIRTRIPKPNRNTVLATHYPDAVLHEVTGLIANMGFAVACGTVIDRTLALEHLATRPLNVALGLQPFGMMGINSTAQLRPAGKMGLEEWKMLLTQSLPLEVLMRWCYSQVNYVFSTVVSRGYFNKG
ncbi:hypothetical protein SAICODRAFT_8645 [Saitoella complicata NRRL Y-17804]|uniref:Uncharacterized protein n=1 Tax=Saitoella complicata (strain BCRC 22490 / CBS 7301 / JCM 7358 / NBRC 10748 / NRRL Y-17804) TaxID=698492 RepID=A0A0E9NLJ4_SAICN|nr:uncharacterized protein SAICODRAFT_8645 [Saitoella complicata NRRL Y-17804]ODQ51713.1 hypothetical protein SAICODRAFT_8645 [Saitoella complicata NRRL Y-17804]GAO50668.1 hypothetical protein G7K_4790-t1 [Saitoella complicata NRRL Y-17804]